MSEINNKELDKISRELSYYLRHKPEEIGLNMNSEGWVRIKELEEKAGNRFNSDTLKIIVDTDKKNRYSMSEIDGSGEIYIRANQGHSTKQVNISFKEVYRDLPLYHGTSSKVSKIIQDTGLKGMSRAYVHLSDNIETAKNVGLRHTRNGESKLVIFEIDTKRMMEDNVKLYISDNGVWLTEYVSPQYIKIVTQDLA